MVFLHAWLVSESVKLVTMHNFNKVLWEFDLILLLHNLEGRDILSSNHDR